MDMFSIQEPVMQRVRVIYFLRTLTWPVIVEVCIVGSVLGISTFFVSFADILLNSKMGNTSLFSYLLSAAMHTGVVEKSLLVGTALFSLFFVWQVSRSAIRVFRAPTRMSENSVKPA